MTLKGGTIMKSRKSRVAVLIMSFAITLVIFSASIFIAENITHNCTGTDCIVCAEIEQCENAINTIGIALSGFMLVNVAAMVILIKVIGSKRTVKRHKTLITLKVELLS